jgi:hypothetical protein
VSEIITKLGVETRQEAATWRGQPRTVPAPAAAPSIWQRAGLTTPVRVFAAAVIAAVPLGLLALAIGLLLMNSRDGDESAVRLGNTDEEELAAIVESLITADAASLATRFSGVVAREGAIIGGPVALAQVQPVSSDEWSARLASSDRSLYSVVKTPSEPFPWMQATGSRPALASLFEGARDFDVLLIVEDDVRQSPWRFSILDGRVVDIIIDRPDNPAGAPPQAQRPLLTKLANLMPSPADDPGSFLTLPPMELWPSLTGRTSTAPPRAADVRFPAFAPNGRSGKPELERAIDALVSADTAALSRAYPELAGREHHCAEIIDQFCNYREIRVPNDEWTRRLASAKRSLYAVATAVGMYTEIVLLVDSESRAGEAWVFAFDGVTIRGLTIYPPEPGMTAMPRLERMIEIGVPSPVYRLEQFFVRPPADDLPQPPLGHPLSVAMSDASVDALLSVVEARDLAAFASAIPSAGTSLRRCGEDDLILDARAAREWAADQLPRVRDVVSIISLPMGYLPKADHMIVMRTQVAPYRWASIAVLQGGGEILGLIEGEEHCGPDRLQPPESFLLPPPAQGLSSLDPGRRSGVGMIDEVLQVLKGGKEAEIISLIEYRPFPCGGERAPVCPPGSLTGTPVEAIPHEMCGPGFDTAAQAPGVLSRDWSQESLYAVTSLANGRDGALVILTGPDGSMALELEESKIVAISSGCGPAHPDSLLQGKTSYLLAPR